MQNTASDLLRYRRQSPSYSSDLRYIFYHYSIDIQRTYLSGLEDLLSATHSNISLPYLADHDEVYAELSVISATEAVKLGYFPVYSFHYNAGSQAAVAG